MRDPFPFPPPQWLQSAVQPLAERLSLPTLTLHIHEVIFALAAYQFVNAVLSPWLSARLFPATYPKFNRRTRINWDVHVVSLVQSLVVNGYALYLMFFNDTRAEMNWVGRIWGYDGASGLLQAIAAGYFLWDLYMCSVHIDIFGVGMLFHAISAVTVFFFGFRPFLNYYGPVFILYELSSPALNIHWFLDKLNLTGSTYQLINGIVLISTFFLCRLCWGTINSIWVFQDVWKGMQHANDLQLNLGLPDLGLPNTLDSSSAYGAGSSADPVPALAYSADRDAMHFAAGARSLPVWLALSYLASNIVLNVLNYYWFAKMIETVRKRFDPPFGTRRVGEKKEEKKEKKKGEEVGEEAHSVRGEKLEVEVQKGVQEEEDGRKTFEGRSRRRRG